VAWSSDCNPHPQAIKETSRETNRNDAQGQGRPASLRARAQEEAEGKARAKAGVVDEREGLGIAVDEVRMNQSTDDPEKERDRPPGLPTRQSYVPFSC
jgi:hypothetical protein